MWKAFGICCGIAAASGCGLSQFYEGVGEGSPAASGSNSGGNTNGGSVAGASTSGNSGGSGVGTSGTGSGGIGIGTAAGTGTASGGGIGAGPGGSSGTGAAGTGTATGGSTGGGCVKELGICDPSVGCNCDPSICDCPTFSLSCVYEPLEDGYACEHLCQQTSECPTAYTACTGTSCTLALCGIGIGGPANGTLDGTCNSEGQNDGTCFPASANDGGVYGICYQGGDAGGGDCVSGQTATRDQLSELCPAGSICAMSNMGPGNTCYTLCNPESQDGGDDSCAEDGFVNGCSALSVDPPIGICF